MPGGFRPMFDSLIPQQPLPAGADWVHVWSGTTFRGGQRTTVPAPLGQPPVFFRANSAHQRVFQSLPAIAG